GNRRPHAQSRAPHASGPASKWLLSSDACHSKRARCVVARGSPSGRGGKVLPIVETDGGSLVKAYEFPPAFLWGAATSAYQVEGSPLADGAGPSIWHRFVRTPGLVKDGHTGDVACDHYRRMKDDVLMMKRLGLTAYRFSVAWGRV